MVQPKQLEILAKGERWCAVNKPAGIGTERHFDHDTVEARALGQFRRPRSLKDPFVGVVHRLDRPVSGVLLLARNKSTLVALNGAFAERKTEKIYWAITQGALPAEAGTLRHFLARDRMGKRAIASTRPIPNAKEATLDYRLLRTHDGLYLWELRPVTGRFHQLRVQLSAAGCPILGDADYRSPRPLQPNCIALHARQLAFPNPKTGEKVIVRAELPDYWPLP